MSNLGFPSGHKFIAISPHIFSCYHEGFGCDLGDSPFSICRVLDPTWLCLHQYSDIVVRYLLQMLLGVPRVGTSQHPRIGSVCGCVCSNSFSYPRFLPYRECHVNVHACREPGWRMWVQGPAITPVFSLSGGFGHCYFEYFLNLF